MKINLIVFILIVIVMAISCLSWYNAKMTKYTELSEYWYLTSNAEAGYLIYSTCKSEYLDFDYINLDGLYLDKVNKVIFIKNENTGEALPQYGKIYLNRCNFYNINIRDSVQIGNKNTCIRDVPFIPAWRVKLFGL